MAAVVDCPLLRERELVQDLGKDPLPKFIQKETMPGILEGTLPLIDVPIVDISLLTSPSELQKLGTALNEYGCCVAINHGFPAELLERLRDASAEFFEQPLEEKLKCVRPAVHWEGYGFDQSPDVYVHDWSDRVMILIGPEKDTQLQYWPHKPADFRNMMKECAIKTKELSEVVLRAMARVVKLEDENCFVTEVGEFPVILNRLNLYPPCSRPDKVLGINEHTDGSTLTFLLQDREVEGFQIFKDGQWFRVGVKPTDGLLIKIGDQGEIISNGVFKAPLHRGALNTEKTRISVAFFAIPEADKLIGPVEALVTESRPAKYKKVVNYLYNHLKVANHRELIESTKLL